MSLMFQLWQRRVRRTTVIMVGCVAFLAGLALPKAGFVMASDFLLLLAAICLLALCAKRRLLVAVPAIILCGLLCGIWRGSVVQSSVAVYRENFGRKVVMQGTLSQDTAYGNKNQLDLYISDATLSGQQAPGVVRVTTFDPIEPRLGDVVQVQGKLMDGFGGYQAAIYFATVRIVQPSGSWLEQLRRSFTTNILNSLPEPQASLGLGFLVGL